MFTKSNNNYEGIYYNSSHLAQIFVKEKSPKALDLLIEAKKSAEFINDNYLIIDASLALGDYYYNNPNTYKEALTEYMKAKTIADMVGESEYLRNCDRRIKDMQLRMTKEDYDEMAEFMEKL